MTLDEQKDDAAITQTLKDLEEACAFADSCFFRLAEEMKAADNSVQQVYSQLRSEKPSEGRMEPILFSDPAGGQDSDKP